MCVLYVIYLVCIPKYPSPGHNPEPPMQVPEGGSWPRIGPHVLDWGCEKPASKTKMGTLKDSIYHLPPSSGPSSWQIVRTGIDPSSSLDGGSSIRDPPVMVVQSHMRLYRKGSLFCILLLVGFASAYGMPSDSMCSTWLRGDILCSATSARRTSTFIHHSAWSRIHILAHHDN